MRTAAIITAVLSLGLSFSATAGEVAGTVYDQRGTPVAGVVLSVDGQVTETDAAGSYSFANVAAGQQLVSANGQRVAVEVAEEGVATRNIFLLSQRARTEVTGAAMDNETTDDAFEEALELADRMLENGPASGEVTWRWNDHEA